MAGEWAKLADELKKTTTPAKKKGPSLMEKLAEIEASLKAKK